MISYDIHIVAGYRGLAARFVSPSTSMRAWPGTHAAAGSQLAFRGARGLPR